MTRVLEHYETQTDENAVAEDEVEVDLEDPFWSRIGAEDDRWMCKATKQMRPSLAALRETRSRMVELAEQFAGRYDGWRARVDLSRGSDRPQTERTR